MCDRSLRVINVCDNFVRVVWVCDSAGRGERMRVAGRSGVGAAETRSSMLMRIVVCKSVLCVSEKSLSACCMKSLKRRCGVEVCGWK